MQEREAVKEEESLVSPGQWMMQGDRNQGRKVSRKRAECC